ncbi:MAG: hypothetical protein M1816_003127 [Peltula sp. TS41687]|nr:MAG: hypothetical protein M1816_003127 [Peltula sp. TS41687]
MPATTRSASHSVRQPNHASTLLHPTFEQPATADGSITADEEGTAFDSQYYSGYPPASGSENPRAVPSQPPPRFATYSKLAASAGQFISHVEEMVEQAVTQSAMNQARSTAEFVSVQQMVYNSLEDLQGEIRSGFATSRIAMNQVRTMAELINSLHMECGGLEDLQMEVRSGVANLVDAIAAESGGDGPSAPAQSLKRW